MLYIKDLKTSTCKHIVLNNRLIINPTASQIAEAGWTEYVAPVVERTNEDVDTDRRLAYQSESDSYYIAYQAYLAEGLTEKAEEAKATWLAKRAEIQERYPSVEA